MSRLERVDATLHRVGRGDLVAGLAEHAREDPTDLRLVVHEEHAGLGGRAHAWAGSSRVKVVPRPRSLAARMDPPCSSTMRRVMASPSPVPRTFVV